MSVDTKLPSITEPIPDLQSLAKTVRQIKEFCNVLATNQSGVAGRQYFELGVDSGPDSLRAQLAQLRAEFDAYTKKHP